MVFSSKFRPIFFSVFHLRRCPSTRVSSSGHPEPGRRLQRPQAGQRPHLEARRSPGSNKSDRGFVEPLNLRCVFRLGKLAVKIANRTNSSEETA